MESKVYYAMSFYNTTDTMQTEKKAREQFEIHIMPTPVSYTHLDVYKRQA